MTKNCCNPGCGCPAATHCAGCGKAYEVKIIDSTIQAVEEDARRHNIHPESAPVDDDDSPLPLDEEDIALLDADDNALREAVRKAKREERERCIFQIEEIIVAAREAEIHLTKQGLRGASLVQERNIDAYKIILNRIRALPDVDGK